MKPGLSRTRRLLAAAGEPQRAFRSVVVGGTNGKGSVCAMIHSVLCRAGLRAGLYTSPHLVRFNERIRIGSGPGSGGGVAPMISDDEVAGLFEYVSSLAGPGGDGPTFFEYTTVMALEHFRRSAVDAAVLEVGMGGRLDAVNAVEEPVVTVITSVGLDHTRFLGSTVEEVAAEKAGIIKEGVPVVTAVERPGALSVIERRAARAGAPLYRLGREFGFTERGAGVFDYRSIGGERVEAIEVGLGGAHQLRNAACAAAAVELMADAGLPVGLDSLRAALEGCCWPGRFEVVSTSPLVVLDCAHNPDAAAALAAALRALEYERLILVIGVLADKDAGRILSSLVPLADLVVLTRPRCARAADPARLEAPAMRYGGRTLVCEPVGDAVKLALERARTGDAVCVTGSVYTVGEAAAAITPAAAASPQAPPGPSAPGPATANPAPAGR